jgi:hypothetical protein
MQCFSQLTRAAGDAQELVALFNTLWKFSSAIQAIDVLWQEYVDARKPTFKSDILSEQVPAPAPIIPASVSSREQTEQPFASTLPAMDHKTNGAQKDGLRAEFDAVDSGVSVVARAVAAGALDPAIEDGIIDGLLNHDEDMLLLAKHYASKLPERFLQHAVRRSRVRPNALGNAGWGDAAQHEDLDVVDAVVIGGGLAGLSAALTILDAGGRVVVLEKMGHLGGNSAWASSGVNAVDVNNTASGDSVEIFTADVVKAAGRGDNPLIHVLTEGSVDSLAWLRSRLAENLNLDLVGQMGGHSKARTHRPSSGLAGSAMIFALQKQVEKYMAAPAGGRAKFELMKWTRATKLVTKGQTVVGVEYKVVTAKDQDTAVRTGVVLGRNVLIATGGYASDYQADSLLKKHRPDLLPYATTNNKGTTGDGHKLALEVGAHAVDMDDVQVHPTGFHNPADPSNKVKTLAAEITRGEGAILLHRGGLRFVNELGGRDYVTGRMLETAKSSPPVKEADGTDGSLLYALVMNSKGAVKTAKHIDLYTKKKLLTRFDSLKDLAAWSYWNASVSEQSLRYHLRAVFCT